MESIHGGYLPSQDGKIGFNELPDSIHFIYNLDQGFELKKEVITILKNYGLSQWTMNKKLNPKFIGLEGRTTAVIIHLKDKRYPEVVGICRKADLSKTTKKLQTIFK